jgi:hypothetical protein
VIHLLISRRRLEKPALMSPTLIRHRITGLEAVAVVEDWADDSEWAAAAEVESEVKNITIPWQLEEKNNFDLLYVYQVLVAAWVIQFHWPFQHQV